MCSIMGYSGKRISAHEFKKGFEKTISRGPDESRILYPDHGIMAFHRLAIMGLTPEGMQPFVCEKDMVVCNGEIYGFRKIKKELRKMGYTFKSDSDC